MLQLSDRALALARLGRVRGPRASVRAPPRPARRPRPRRRPRRARARRRGRSRRRRARRRRRHDRPSKPPCGVAAPRPWPAAAGGRAFGFAAAAEREPAAGQQLEPLGPPDAWDERKLVAPRRRGEGIDGASLDRRSRGARRRAPPRPRRRGSDRARSSARRTPRRWRARSRRRRRRAPRSERLPRFPASAWTLPDNRAPSTALSSSSAASASWPRSNLTWPRIEYGSGMNSLWPVARPTAMRSFGVGFRLLVAVEIELGAGQVGGGIEPKGELVIVQVRDERGRLRATRFGLRRGTAGRACEREHGDRGRGQRPVAERPCGAERSLGPLAHQLVVHAEEAVHRELDHERRRLAASRDRAGRPSRSRGARAPARGGRAGARRRHMRS